MAKKKKEEKPKEEIKEIKPTEINKLDLDAITFITKKRIDHNHIEIVYHFKDGTSVSKIINK